MYVPFSLIFCQSLFYILTALPSKSIFYFYFRKCIDQNWKTLSLLAIDLNASQSHHSLTHLPTPGPRFAHPALHPLHMRTRTDSIESSITSHFKRLSSHIPWYIPIRPTRDLKYSSNTASPLIIEALSQHSLNRNPSPAKQHNG